MSALAVIGILYGVIAISAFGFIGGWKGYEDPWPALGLIWPAAVIIWGAHSLAAHIKHAGEMRRALDRQNRQEQERLLREAGIEP